jgi:hypothetical protein
MKLKFNLFFHRVQVNIDGGEGYFVRIVHKGLCELPDITFVERTYLGARFKAWRLARSYASMYGWEQAVFIYHEYSRTEESNSPIWWGILPVRKSAGFFFKTK